MATVGIELGDIGANCVLIGRWVLANAGDGWRGRHFPCLRLRSGRGIDVWLYSSGYSIRLSPYVQRVLG